LALGPAEIDPHILAVDESSFAQTLPEGGEEWHKCLRRRAVKEPDHWHGLLCARRERPRSRPAYQRDELAPLHSITSSARAGKRSAKS
jgi:hypothetical protein